MIADEVSSGTDLPFADPAFRRYQHVRSAHWDSVARRQRDVGFAVSSYRRRLIEVYRSAVAPGLRILEIGCGDGDLLAALQPRVGVGLDLSSEMVARAARRHSGLRFVQADGHALPLRGDFDVVVLSDLVNDLWDVQAVLEELARLSGPRTRVILNVFSRLWGPTLALGRRMGLARPNLEQNWLAVEDVVGLLYLADFEVIRQWAEVVWPLPTPPLDAVLNRVAVKLWPFSLVALTNFFVARLRRPGRGRRIEPSVSVIVPARNEAGNIEAIFARMPELGRSTELVFVEGHSRDDTYVAIERTIARYPGRQARLLRQTGVGKGDAVRMGFAQASGDIVLILDADLTVAPEDLPRFVEVLRSGKGEFVNGVRLVYPMEEQAMRFLNLLGNKLFSIAFSWILGQPVKDTLCGTKGLWREDYQRIAANRAYFGDFDPFGDFDLLFGATRANLRIVDLPIRYRQRVYGTTNIQRGRHGLLLLRMLLYAGRRLKFV